MKKLFLLLSIIFLFGSPRVFAQEKPKLVVGIVVDQMRMDYLYRYYDRFGEDGFRRLVEQGFTFHNGHYNYVPTSTAPGHTSIYTGTTPAYHGVIGNSWYDKFLRETVYCAYDSNAVTVGADNNNGKMSPHRMLTTTFTDELRLASKNSKVIGISIKDRGAIFPAGHRGEAFWYDSKTGDFISSTFYGDELPSWVKSFNRKNRAEVYLSKKWETLYPIETYTASGPDESPYEGGLFGKTTFPYDLSADKENQFGVLPSTPYGNEILIDLAKAAIDAEALGADNVTDVLAVSFSSTDYIGHNFGPNSIEVEDTYLRLDQSIAKLLAYLDEKVGKDAYTVFLTADHAVANVPKRMMDLKVSAGYLRKNVVNEVNTYLSGIYGEGEWVEAYSSGQLFLNYRKIADAKLEPSQVADALAHYMINQDGIANVYTREDLTRGSFSDSGVKGLMVRGFHQRRGGDVFVMLNPGWLTSSNDHGTSHGTAYRYDTHVPIIFYGHSIKQGSSTEERHVTDIAPTMSYLLQTTMPNGSIGQVLSEALME